MKISLIICTRNRHDVLINNLIINTRELEQHDEVIIVDSSDKCLSEHYKTKIQIPNIFFYHVKPGLPLQRNYGINKASGDIILFLDDDIRLCDDSIPNLKNYFKTNSHIDAVTGALSEKNEPSRLKRYLEHFLSYFFFTPAFGRSAFTKSGLPIIPLSHEPFHQALFLRGGFTAYRNHVFEKYRFDEFFNGYSYLEDTDFSLSIKTDTTSVFLPEFRGFHDHLSTQIFDQTLPRMQYIENYYYIFNKYKIGGKLLFFWTATGILLINFIKSIMSFNFSFLKGTFFGIRNVILNPYTYQR